MTDLLSSRCTIRGDIATQRNGKLSVISRRQLGNGSKLRDLAGTDEPG